MMFCFKIILQIWIILIGFRDTNDFLNLSICKHEFKFTCRGYCRFTYLVSYWTYKKLTRLSFQIFLIYKKLDSLIWKKRVSYKPGLAIC